MEWSSTPGTYQYFQTWGTEFRIIREEETFKIYMEEEKLFIGVFFFSSCGEPDLAVFPT